MEQTVMDQQLKEKDSKLTEDPQSGRRIRPTDNSLKEGDFEAPQDAEPLELDENGLPAFVYAAIEEVR